MKTFPKYSAIPLTNLGLLALVIIGSCSSKHLVSIAVSPQAASVSAVGQAVQFQALGSTNHPNAGQETLTTTVTWASSTPSMATIDHNGLATAIGCGQTTITAQDGNVMGQTTFTNTCSSSGGGTPVLQSINLYPSSPAIPQLGQSVQFIALAIYNPVTSNNDVTNLVTWASSNPGVATISSTGLATAVSCGSTNITSKYLNVIGQTPLTVQCTANQTLQSITVLPGSPTVPQIGQTTQFLALGALVGGGQEDLTSSATWSSSNPQVASVGLHTGTAATVNCGTTTISAEFQPSNGTPVAGTSLLTVSCNSITSIELVVQKFGNAGTVTSTPLGIDCGAVCGGLFNEGTGFVLTPGPSATWVATQCDQIIADACYFTLLPDSPGGSQKLITVTF